MKDRKHILRIERIVMTDIGVAPERAERIRSLMEVELQRLLNRDGMPGGLSSGRVSNLTVPAIRLSPPHSDTRLAAGVSHSISQALQGLGRTRTTR